MKGIARELKSRISDDKLSVISAGVAFYALLAIFPGLAALISIYGMLFDPQQVEQQLAVVKDVIPPAAADILLKQLGDISGSQKGALGLGAAGGLLLTLWSASAGIRNLMKALNVAYHEEETRGTVKFLLVALAFTLGGILAMVLAIGLVVALPAIIAFLPLSGVLETVLNIARWPIIALVIALGLGVLYRYGPCRHGPPGRLVGWGAGIGTLLWLVGSGLFSFYVSSFANYNETYGSVGAVVVLLLWFLLSAYSVLIGAEIDAIIKKGRRPGAHADGNPPQASRR